MGSLVCLSHPSNSEEAHKSFTSGQTAERLDVVFGGYVDAFYGYTWDNPSTIDHAYGNGVYNAAFARNNEFNINLAFLEAKVSNHNDVRARLALQTGTNADALFASEPNIGNISGPAISRNIQEASIGYKLGDELWLDVGVYPSHLGIETMITRDNWNYTRSVLADVTPYYQSGAKLTYEPSKTWSGQLNVINGWQNISENNSNKAVGLQVNYHRNEKLALTYDNYIGQETPAGTTLNLNRFVNELIASYDFSEAWSFAAEFDQGMQARASGSSNDSWTGWEILAKRNLSSTKRVAARFERYADPQQILVPVLPGATTSNGYSVWSATATYSQDLKKYLLWRAELRYLWSSDQVFASNTTFANSDLFAVTSLALSF